MRWPVVVAIVGSAASASADVNPAFTAGLGYAWPDFVPAQSQTLDPGQSGFAEVGAPVFATDDRQLAVEVGGRFSLGHFEGQQYPGGIPAIYSYLPYSLLAEGKLVYARRAWLSLAAGYYQAQYRSSPTSNDVVTHTEGRGLALAATLGADVYSGLGAYVEVTHLAQEGATYGFGLAFRIGGAR